MLTEKDWGRMYIWICGILARTNYCESSQTFMKVFQIGNDIFLWIQYQLYLQHIICGGLAVDLNGETTVRNLFSVGDVPHWSSWRQSASNSLLEAAVFSVNAATFWPSSRHQSPHHYRFGMTVTSNPDEQVVIPGLG